MLPAHLFSQGDSDRTSQLDVAEQLVLVRTKAPIKGLFDRPRGVVSENLRQFEERLGLWRNGVGLRKVRVGDRVSIDAGERIWQLLRQSGPNSNVELPIQEDIEVLIEQVWCVTFCWLGRLL